MLTRAANRKEKKLLAADEGPKEVLVKLELPGQTYRRRASRKSVTQFPDQPRHGAGSLLTLQTVASLQQSSGETWENSTRT